MTTSTRKRSAGFTNPPQAPKQLARARQIARENVQRLKAQAKEPLQLPPLRPGECTADSPRPAPPTREEARTRREQPWLADAPVPLAASIESLLPK